MGSVGPGPSVLDSQTKRRLVHVKAVYSQGLRLSKAGGEIEGGLAVVAFDNSLEMMMYTCLEYNQSKVKERIDLEGLLDLASKALTNLGKDTRGILRPVEVRNLRKARNAVQHEGNMPSRGDVERFASTTVSVLRRVCSEVFAVDFDEVSLAQLIRESGVRDEFLKADAAYSEGKYPESLVRCGCAFYSAMLMEEGRLFGSSMTAVRPTVKGEESQKLLNYANKLAEEIEVLKLGLDYKAYQKFRQSFGFKLGVWEVLGAPDDFPALEKELWERTKGLYDSADPSLRTTTRFCLDFAVDSILRWEAVERKAWFEVIGDIVGAALRKRQTSSSFAMTGVSSLTNDSVGEPAEST